jgi:4,5-DOPA dioxygenase extradiol
MLPSLFVSHGSPALVLTECPARTFLSALGGMIDARYGRPRAIVVASAHWEAERPCINTGGGPNGTQVTIHDFHGFPAPLYELRYPAPGPRALADRVGGLLLGAGLKQAIAPGRGLDHGAWVPLLMMYPEADIPVLQVSVQTPLGPAHHLALGEALAPLRGDGVLVIGSGSFTHDLGEFRHGRPAIDAPEPAWVSQFADWFTGALTGDRLEDMLSYRQRAPFGAKNHPTEEHILPLFVARGAGGSGCEHLHASTTYGFLRMDVFAFHGSDEAC